MYKTLSFQKKLTLLTSIAFLVALLIGSFLSSSLTRNLLSDRLLGQELPAAMGSINQAIRANITAPMQSSKLLAESYFIETWLDRNESEDLKDHTINYLKQIKRSSNADVVFFISNKTSNYYTEKGVIKQVNRQNDGWFYGFLDTKQPFELSLDYFKGTGPLTLFMNYRVGDGEGIAGLGLKVEALSKLIKEYTLEESGYVFLTTPDGKITIHPDQSLVGKNISEIDSLANFPTEMLNNSEFASDYMSNSSGDFIVASELIPEINYVLNAVIPENELYEALNQTQFISFLVTLVILVVTLILLALVIAKATFPIKKTANLLEDIGHGEGDLTKRIKVLSEDEIGQLANGFNNFVGKLQNIIQQVVQKSNGVLSLSDDVHQQSTFSLEQTHQQRASIESLASAMSQMGSTVQEIASNASNAAELAQTASAQVEKGSNVVETSISRIQSLSEDMSHASEVISELSQHSESIGGILSVIRGISEQTNLLALNAAIEAARAGEQGRGFAVVADEVRSLAQKTSESTDEIQKMIEQLQSGSRKAVDVISKGRDSTAESVESVHLAGTALNEISTAVESINSINFQVATATEEQSQVIEEINNNVIKIEDASAHNSDIAEQLSGLADQLSGFANELSDMMAQFKI